MSHEKLRLLVERLGTEVPEELVKAALTHASYANETGEGEANERLEFLGDAVLDLALADILYHRFPERDEGELSKIRAVVVSRPVLAEVARRLELGPLLLLGKGEEQAGGRERPSILAAALEALFGVVFLHLGYATARELAERLLGEEIERYAAERSPDYKSLLQELGQRRYGALPAYNLIESEGPEHKKVFTVSVELGGSKALGRGRSKKEAEQAAAKRLYLRLEEDEPEKPEEA